MHWIKTIASREIEELRLEQHSLKCLLRSISPARSTAKMCPRSVPFKIMKRSSILIQTINKKGLI